MKKASREWGSRVFGKRDTSNDVSTRDMRVLRFEGEVLRSQLLPKKQRYCSKGGITRRAEMNA